MQTAGISTCSTDNPRTDSRILEKKEEIPAVSCNVQCITSTMATTYTANLVSSPSKYLRSPLTYVTKSPSFIISLQHDTHAEMIQFLFTTNFQKTLQIKTDYSCFDFLSSRTFELL